MTASNASEASAQSALPTRSDRGIGMIVSQFLPLFLAFQADRDGTTGRLTLAAGALFTTGLLVRFFFPSPTFYRRPIGRPRHIATLGIFLLLSWSPGFLQNIYPPVLHLFDSHLGVAFLIIGPFMSVAIRPDLPAFDRINFLNIPLPLKFALIYPLLAIALVWNLLGRGLFIFALLGIAHHSVSGAQLCLLAAAGDAAWNLLAAPLSRDKRQDYLLIQRLVFLPADRRGSLIAAIARRTRAKNGRRIRLAAEAQAEAHLAVHRAGPRAKADEALAYLDVFEQLLDAFDADDPDWASTSSEKYPLRAMLAGAKGHAARNLQLWDEKLKQDERAAQLLDEASLWDLAALERSSKIRVYLNVLDDEAAARQQLQDVVDSPRVHVLVKQLLAATLGLWLLRVNRTDEALTLADRFDLAHLARDDLPVVLGQDDPPRWRWGTQAFTQEALFKQLTAETNMLMSQLTGEPYKAPLRRWLLRFANNPVTPVAGGGMLQGLASFEAAMKRADLDDPKATLGRVRRMEQQMADGDPLLHYQALIMKARLAASAGEDLEAYHALRSAFELSDKQRLLVEDRETRRHLGAVDDTYFLAVDLLLANGGKPGFPEQVEAEAFRTSELYRARSLLDLMSEAGRSALPAAAGRGGTPATFEQVRHALLSAERATLLVEYLIGEDEILMFILSAGNSRPAVHRIEVPFLPQIRGTRTFLPYELLDFAYEKMLTDLVEPIFEASEPGDTIWIIPHQLLHGIPLGAVERVSSGEPLIFRNPVCVGPSASVMLSAPAPGASGLQTVTCFADTDANNPLLYARIEASSIARHFGNARSIIGEQSSRPAVLEAMAAGSDVLHFACHATYLPDDPWKSSITLACGDSLTARDILGADVSTSLVVLSACSSGKTFRRRGEDLVGLTRAFVQQGVRSLIVSLWEVDDISMSILMDRFYAGLATGGTVAVSLASAQKHLSAITLREAAEYCRDAAEAASDKETQLLLSHDAAMLRLQAGDHDRVAEYLDLYEEVELQAAARRDLRRELARARARARTSPRSTVEDLYDRPAFSDPYFWASLVVVGPGD
jgi:CHAT domain-containing protein